MQKIVIDEQLNGLTIKQLFEKLQYSTSQIKRLKYDGEILVNGELCTVRRALKTGDIVTLRTFNRLETPAFAPFAANVLFADEYLYVASKPYNVATHPDRTHKNDTFGNMLATAFGEGFELRIITRLDKTTSGLVLGAFDGITAEKLNVLQKRHEITKRYIALVEGILTKNGEINLPLLRLDNENKTIVSKQGKPAVTKYEIVENRQSQTLLCLYPLTGRTHQIRAHLSALGHPIVGDELYGASHGDRLKLHCERITFTHPYTGKTVDIVSTIEF